MTDYIQLSAEINEQLVQLEKLIKIAPQILINILLKIGIIELKEAFELLPEKSKTALLNELKSVMKEFKV